MKKYSKLLPLLIIALLASCAGYYDLPEQTVKDAIKTDVNMRLVNDGDTNIIASETKVDNYKIIDESQPFSILGNKKNIEYQANVTVVDSVTLKPYSKEMSGSIAFTKNTGIWWSESLNMNPGSSRE